MIQTAFSAYFQRPPGDVSLVDITTGEVLARGVLDGASGDGDRGTLTVTLRHVELPEIDVKAALTRTKTWTEEAARGFLGLKAPAIFRAERGLAPGARRSGRTLEAAVRGAVAILNGRAVFLVATDLAGTVALRGAIESYVKALGGTVRDGDITLGPTAVGLVSAACAVSVLDPS